jgi:DNA-binding beta-propeller fold protein YncE
MKKFVILTSLFLMSILLFGQIEKWMYITDRNDGIVKYINMDDPSSIMQFATGDLYKPYGIAVDPENGYVFVSDTDGFIFRYNLDGTEVITILNVAANPLVDAPYGLMVLDGKLYWGREGGIGRCNFDGSEAELWLDQTSGAAPEMPLCLAYNEENNKIYFTNDKYDFSGGVYTINTDGSGMQEIVSGTDGGAIVVDTENDYIFYADWLKGICRNNFDGTAEVVIDPDYVDAFVWGMAVDPAASKVYYANKYDDKVIQANLDGSGQIDFLTGINAHAMALVETGTVGLEDRLNIPEVSLFPNPAHNRINLTGLSAVDRVEIIALDGRLVKSVQTMNNSECVVEVSGFEAGTYLVKIHTDTGNEYVKKILVR